MTKKKIGIVTLHGYHNYGNHLQNLATKYILEKLGFDAFTTIVRQPEKKITDKLQGLSKEKIYKLLNSKLNIKKRIYNTKNRKIINNRKNYFKDFSEKYLSERFYTLHNSEDMKELDTYSYFITGSDQVWNPVYYSNLPIYFLTFTDRSKRIAYSPSISRDKLPEEYHVTYKKWLEDMNVISVRENAGANIIKDLTGMEVPVLADPTLLLTKDEWLSISKRAKNRPDTPYILTYFLGGPTPETKERLNKIAKEKNMTIINLGDITEADTYKTGPSEFLDYINNASAFFTDSFHGVVFSIIFQTPFKVYERQYKGASMYSRIKTILDKFNMREREATEFEEDIFEMDFSGTNDVLESEYDKAISYLKDALQIKK